MRTREWCRRSGPRRDVRPLKMRESGLFKNGVAPAVLWQGGGLPARRYQESGELVMIGQFVDREAALELALPS